MISWNCQLGAFGHHCWNKVYATRTFFIFVICMDNTNFAWSKTHIIELWGNTRINFMSFNVVPSQFDIFLPHVQLERYPGISHRFKLPEIVSLANVSHLSGSSYQRIHFHKHLNDNSIERNLGLYILSISISTSKLIRVSIQVSTGPGAEIYYIKTGAKHSSLFQVLIMILAKCFLN